MNFSKEPENSGAPQSNLSNYQVITSKLIKEKKAKNAEKIH